MDWLNLIPRSNIVSSITRMISTTAEYRLTYQPVFRSPISAVLHSHRAPTVLCAYPSTTHRLCRNATQMRRKRGYQKLVSTLLRSRIALSLQLPASEQQLNGIRDVRGADPSR